MLNIDEIIKEAHNVGIAGHMHPDGDCCGSTLGLYNYIITYFPGTNVSVFLEEIPDVFNILPGSDKIINPSDYKKSEDFDIFFALDCSDTARLADSYPLFKSAKKRVCIDHHVSNSGMAEENFIVPDASSTSELVCSLFNPDKITKEIAECLYTGMVHDTGVFQYSCTSSETMRLAGILMDKGIDYPGIIEYTYYEKTLAQNKLLGVALGNARLFDDGRIIASVLSKADFEKVGAKRSDTEGIVGQLRVTKGCDAAVFMYQNPDRTHKVSLRTSGDINLADIALSYGGGGHAKAAGFNVGPDAEKELPKIIEKIIAARSQNADS